MTSPIRALTNVRFAGDLQRAARRSVSIEGERIQGVGASLDASGPAFDGRGLLALPGMVDLHCSALEEHFAPRGRTHGDPAAAVAMARADCRQWGLTTPLYTVCVTLEPAGRTVEAAESLLRELAGERVHLRIELGAATDATDAIVGHSSVAFTSIMNHGPNPLSGWDDAKFLRYVKRSVRLDAEGERALLGRIRRSDGRWHEQLSSLRKRIGGPVAYHDVATVAGIDLVELLVEHRIDVGEFFVDDVALESARVRGFKVIMGAPNVVRGASHNGQVSARKAILEGRCDALCSDYHLPSMLHAPFALLRDHGMPLAQAWGLVSSGPARVAGMDDRGSIAEGQRADLILVDDRATPQIRAVIVGGVPQWLDGDLLPSLLTPSSVGGETSAWAATRPAERKNVESVLSAGRFDHRRGRGTMNGALEQEIARRLDVPFVVTVSSATAGLHAALLALGVGSGHEVVVDPLVRFGGDAALSCNALPAFADVDPTTLLMDPASVSACLTEKTKAVVATAIMGLSADISGIAAAGKERGVRVVEDCAQALFATRGGRYAGTLGDLGVFSFQASKHLPAGDGGAIVTSDRALWRECMKLREHGWDVDGGPSSLGFNFRMTELTAAVLLARLETIDTIVEKHRRVGELLSREARASGLLEPQRVPEDAVHVYGRWAATVTFDVDPARLASALSRAESRIKFPHWGPAYARPMFQQAANLRGYAMVTDAELAARYRKGLCPHAEQVVDRMLEITIDSQKSLDFYSVQIARTLSVLRELRDG